MPLRSCGKRHPWCNICKSNERKFAVIKICGKNHAYCKICRPDICKNIIKSRSKPPKLKGTCKYCGKETSTENTFQCRSCSSRYQYHAPHSLETRRKISNAAKAHADLYLPDCNCWAHRPIPGQYGTNIEIFLQNFLLEAGFCIEANKKFGRKEVDIWINDYGLIFEADGEYWHSLDSKKDPERDKFLLNNYPEIKAIIRMPGQEIRSLQPAPLE